MSRTCARGLAIIAAVVLLAACKMSTVTPAAGGAGPATPAPVFVAFWEAHGGADVFGPALEVAHVDGGRIRQLFVAVEMTADASGGAVSLEPLGLSLGLGEPPVPAPSDPTARYFPSTGHTLYTGFVKAYDDLGGEPVAGPPIAEVSFEGGRIVQAFENIALYREASAAPSEVHLLALGLASSPGHQREVAAAVLPNAHARPFGLFLDQYGGEATFGKAMTEPRPGPDGALEQVYERGILYAPKDSPGTVRLRPLGRDLAPPDPPVSQSGDTIGIYYPQTGHYVLWAFADFFDSHGADKVLGLPLDEGKTIGTVLTQRFENVVLEYHYDLPPGLAVQLAPLGRQRMDGVTQTPSSEPSSTPTVPAPSEGCGGSVTIITHAEHAVLPPGATQRVFVRLTRADGSPLPGLTPIVVVHGPGGDSYPSLPPTDVGGATGFSMSLPDLKPGEIVNYEVVVAGGDCVGYTMDQFAGGLGAP